MRGLTFEWDDEKAKSNLEKHGVDFVDAIQVFSDPMRIERLDTRRDYGEERVQVIGRIGNRLMFVVYTERETAYRLISARKASTDEQEIYDAHHGGPGEPA